MPTPPLAFLETNQERPDILRLPLAEAQTNGGYDALLVAEVLGMSVQEMADYLGRDQAGLRRKPANVSLQKDLGELAVLADLVLLSGTREYLRVWMRTPNPAMGYRTPLARLMTETDTAAVSMTEQIVSVLSGQGQ